MYTGLQHDRIKKNVRSAIEEAKEYAKELYLKEYWYKYPLDSELDDILLIMEHVEFVVDNTFLYSKGGILKQQKIGLPMGTNSAPELANLTCYVDERDEIDDLIKNGK